MLAIALAVVVIARQRGAPLLVDALSICRDLPDHTYINDPRSCRAHWVCMGGETVPALCAPSFNFNPALGLCQADTVFPCTDDAAPPPPPADEDATTTIVAPAPEEVDTQPPPAVSLSCPPRGVFQLPFTATSPHVCTPVYRLCVGGESFVRTCATNMLFDAREQRCNFRSRVACEFECPAVSVAGQVVMVPSQQRCDR